MKCKICNGETRDLLVESNKRLYHICKECEFIFLDENYLVTENAEKTQYSFHNNTKENTGYVEYLERFIEEAITPYAQDVNDVLDFGCGPGPVLYELLKERYKRVDKYDPYFSPEKVFENKKYDLITSTEVFEHLKKPLEVMEFLKDHLKEGGILSLMTGFHNNNQEKFKNWWYIRDQTHICFYTPKVFQKLADLFDLKFLYTNNKNIVVLQKEN